eukprot:SRR837773.25155.p1 GENE.SRR837773.25155~~SRR837773.25155.p1  ORF type:complete len:339 (+),score=12.16 SRR837773.25155:85-1017(+)
MDGAFVEDKADSVGWAATMVSIFSFCFLCAFIFMLHAVGASADIQECCDAFIAFEMLWTFPAEELVDAHHVLEFGMNRQQPQVGFGCGMDDENLLDILHRDQRHLEVAAVKEDSDDGASSRNEDMKIANFDSSPEDVEKFINVWWIWRKFLMINFVDERVKIELIMVITSLWVLMSTGGVLIDVFWSHELLVDTMDVLCLVDCAFVGGALLEMLIVCLNLNSIIISQIEAVRRIPKHSGHGNVGVGHRCKLEQIRNLLGDTPRGSTVGCIRLAGFEVDTSVVKGIAVVISTVGSTQFLRLVHSLHMNVHE